MSESRLDLGLLRDIATALKGDVARRQNIIRAIERATRDNPSQSLPILTLLRQLESYISLLDEPLAATYQSARADAERAFERYLHRYNTYLQELCKIKGWQYSGEYPDYRIEGFVQVQVKESIPEVQVNHLKTNDISVEAVALLIESELKRLLERPFDNPDFMRALFEAYHLAAQLEMVRMGHPFTRERYESVHLKEQFFPLFVLMMQSKSFQRTPRQRQFKDYSLEFFSVDLSRLIYESRSECTYKGFKFQLEKVRRPESSVYVYNRKDNQGDYFGLIRFVPADEARLAE